MEYRLPYLYKPQADHAQALVADIMRHHSQLTLMRYNFERQWEETASLLWPAMRNTFRYLSYMWPGQKLTEAQIDANGMLANMRFAAIVESLTTPANMIWHGLAATDDYIMKDRQSRLWFEAATKALFKWRYLPMSGFRGQSATNYMGLGAFGNHYMFVDELVDMHGQPRRGIRYRSCPVGEIYLIKNFQGIVVGYIRWFRLTARQCYDQYGPDAFPEALVAPLKSESQMLYNFLQRVVPRQDYDPERKDYRGMPYEACTISVEGKWLMAEEGYRCLPLAAGQYIVTPGEDYGRGPATMVLPSLKTSNALEQDNLKVSHRTADPTYMTADDGLVDSTKLLPGVINPGGMNADGKMLIGALPVGKLEANEAALERQHALQNDAFLVSLYQILEKTPNMTATEVIERVTEKGVLIAPTLGRQVEYTGPMVEREIDILMHQPGYSRYQPTLLPPLPGLLREAARAGALEYHVVSTSPLAKMADGQKAAGYMRTLEVFGNVAQQTGDPSVMDFILAGVPRAGPAVADIQGVPESWLGSPQEIDQLRQGRAKQQQVENQIKAAPAQAAIIKANAMVAKTNQQQGVGPVAPPVQQAA